MRLVCTNAEYSASNTGFTPENAQPSTARENTQQRFNSPAEVIFLMTIGLKNHSEKNLQEK
jgi:hypothetical protein